MGDAWLVTGGRDVPWALAPLYADARHRVLHSPKLAPHLDIILGDGYADSDDHLRWVINGRVGEIEAWAKQIREDSDG